MSVLLLHENTKEGTDLDFSIFKEKLPTYFNYSSTNLKQCKDILKYTFDYPGSFEVTRNKSPYPFVDEAAEKNIPDFWEKYIPNEFCFHVHNYCQITFIESGRILYFINNRPVEVGKSDIIIINANIPHTWLAIDNTNIIMASFYPKLVFKDYIDKYSDAQLDLMYSGQYPHMLFKSDGSANIKLMRIFKEIYTEHANKNIASKTIQRMKLFEFSILVMREKLRFPQKTSRYANTYGTIQKALNFISSNMKKDINLNDVAEHVNMNSSYFSHYFKLNTGVPFTSYLSNLRLAAASKILLETDATVTEAAFECGFNSLSTFYQLFKSIYSVSPLKYRKLLRANSNTIYK